MSGEFELIDRISGRFDCPEGVVGIGDDCAVIPQKEGYETLVSTDMLVEGIHFLLNDISPYDLGWKSAAVNISDIAAMGGSPTGTFLGISLNPNKTNEKWIDSFVEGFRDCCLESGTTLLGGDTTSSVGSLSICVTVLGECSKGMSKKRSGARPGDGIYVTGTLGDSACGLKIILDGKDRMSPEAGALLEKHYRPIPQVTKGNLLGSNPKVTAMMDISDGIGSDLRHILEKSGVGATIETGSIPLSPEIVTVCRLNGWDALDFAINGGEDYELLFTASEGFTAPEGYTRIGTITEGSELLSDGPAFHGFNHF